MQHLALSMSTLSVFLAIVLIPALPRLRPARRLAASKIRAAIRRT
ncbi:hypothetical protein [Nitrospira japonica]|nr:hypothetical protein [Nitrospira japonica]